MVELWRCEICGDPYVGEAPPQNCPFCGAHQNFIKLLLRAAHEPELGIFIVLGLRNDEISLCKPFPGLYEAVHQGQFPLFPLNQRELLRAIKKPLQVHGQNI